jgi:hypothetical protein
VTEPAWEPTGRLALEHDYADAAELLEARFASYLDPATDPDLAAAYDHDRYLFGDGFPALTVEEAGSAGRAEKKSRLPERMLFFVRVYHPSLYGAVNPLSGTFDVSPDGDARAEAKRFTRRVFGRWEEAFRKDRRLRLAVDDAFVAETEGGDADRLGNLRVSAEGDSVLWVMRAAVEIRP